MSKNKRIIAGVAGRSGGHIIPCITHLAASSPSENQDDIMLFSTTTDLDRSLLALYPQITYVPLTLDPFPGKKLLRYPAFFIQCIRAFIRSYKTLRSKKVEWLVSTGGYIALPVCAAARMLGIPIEGYELNAVPGKALLWLAPYTSTLHVCFEEAALFFKPYPCQKAEYPLRFTSKDLISKKEGLDHYELDPHKKTLLVVGGSQGSQSINELVITFIKNHPGLTSKIQLLHQAGGNKSAALRSFYHEAGVAACVFDYEHTLQYAYAAADYVIARAGAGTLFELEFFHKKTLLIPLETSSTMHQVENAQAFVKKNSDYFSMVRQKEVVQHPDLLAQKIIQELELL